MTSFPLHKLSINAIQLVLKHMTLEEQIAYSFCTKSTKNTVKQLNLSKKIIRFDVGIYMIDLTVFTDSQDPIMFILPLDLTSFPKIVEFSIRVGFTGTETWSLPEFSTQKILHHFLDIFHSPKLDDLYFEFEVVHFEVIETILKILDGVKIGCLGLTRGLNEQFRRWAIERFQNYYDELYVLNFNGQEVEKILMQNLRRVLTFYSYDLTIDHVLLSNFEMIQLSEALFVEKDFNRFLKLWIRGSNPRLKKFHSESPPPYRRFQAELILKGIKYKQIPLDSEEFHRRKMIGWEDETRLAGGFKIKRFNGDYGVVLIDKYSFNFITDCFD